MPIAFFCNLTFYNKNAELQMLYDANTLNWCTNYTKQVTYSRVNLKAVQ